MFSKSKISRILNSDRQDTPRSYLRVDGSRIQVRRHLLQGSYSSKPHVGDAVMCPSQNQLKYISHQHACCTPLLTDRVTTSDFHCGSMKFLEVTNIASHAVKGGQLFVPITMAALVNRRVQQKQSVSCALATHLAVGQLLQRIEDGNPDKVKRRFVVETVNTRKNLLLQPICAAHFAQSLQPL